jgi:hypothetical protein
MSDSIQIADAVVTALNAKTFSQSFTSTTNDAGKRNWRG